MQSVADYPRTIFFFYQIEWIGGVQTYLADAYNTEAEQPAR